MKRGCPSGPTFFGLTPQYKFELHKSIMRVAYYSNGAFDVEQLYNMPVYLRNFYIKQLEDIKVKEAEVINSAQKRSKQSKR